MIRFGKNPISLKQPISFVAKVFARPRVTVAPKISGTGAVGVIQTRVPGSWTAGTVTWSWWIDGQEVQVGGAYTPLAGDVGKILTLLERATAANGLGASSRSAPLVVIP